MPTATQRPPDGPRGAPEAVRWGKRERAVLLAAFYGRTDGLSMAEALRLTGVPLGRARGILTGLARDGYLEKVAIGDDWRPEVLKITTEGSRALQSAPHSEGYAYRDYDGNVTTTKGEQP